MKAVPGNRGYMGLEVTETTHINSAFGTASEQVVRRFQKCGRESRGAQRPLLEDDLGQLRAVVEVDSLTATKAAKELRRGHAISVIWLEQSGS